MRLLATACSPPATVDSVLRRVLAQVCHITRPLAPPYSLHIVLLKVESYNVVAELRRPPAQVAGGDERQHVPRGGAGLPGPETAIFGG